MKYSKIVFCTLLVIFLCFSVCGCSTQKDIYTVDFSDGISKEMTHKELLKWQEQNGMENLGNCDITGVGIVKEVFVSATNIVWSSGNCQRNKVKIVLDTGTEIYIDVLIPEPGYGKSSSNKLGNYTGLSVGDKIRFTTKGAQPSYTSERVCSSIREEGGINLSYRVKLEDNNKEYYYKLNPYGIAGAEQLEILEKLWCEQVEFITVLGYDS